MTTITLNHKSKTIEMTKKFEKAASRYGSEEYNQLQEVRRDYPGYREVIKTTNRKKPVSYKGLTYEYMEKYIEKHDDENKTIMATFKMFRGESEEAIELNAESLSYIEIKNWFLKKYPAVAEFQKMREDLLAA